MCSRILKKADASKFLFWEYIKGTFVAEWDGGEGLEPKKRTEKVPAPIH